MQSLQGAQLLNQHQGVLTGSLGSSRGQGPRCGAEFREDLLGREAANATANGRLSEITCGNQVS